MSTSTLGVGAAPAGGSIGGYGSPATTSPHVAQVFSPPAVAIDPTTRDYTFDADGNRNRMSSAQQLVLLALTQTLGQSAVPGLGVAPTPGVVSQKTVAHLTADVFRALSHLTSSKPPMIQIIDVQVVRDGARVGRFLRWRDLSTKQEVTTPIPGHS
jgi:hypothetical protein